MDSSSQSSFQKATVTVLVLVVVCLAVAYFGTLKMWQKYAAASDQLKVDQANNTKLQTALQTLQKFLDEYKTHATDAKVAGLALPVKSLDSSDLLGNLSDLAKASGVVLSDMHLQETTSVAIPAAGNSIQAQNMTFTAVGSYPAFKDFMLRLESSLRLMDIQHVNLKIDDTGQLMYDVTLKAYYQK